LLEHIDDIGARQQTAFFERQAERKNQVGAAQNEMG
jgi:hypothetical protein